MSSPGPPPPAPDYQGAATATAQGNLDYAQYTTAANRPNVQTPWGTETWTPGATNGSGWTEAIGLTPAEQQALDSQQNIQKNQGTLANTLQGQEATTMGSGFTPPSLSTYMDAVQPLNEKYTGFNPSASGVSATPQYDASTANAGIKSAYDAQMGLVAPQEKQETQSTENSLALQGLTPGTEAYNNAMQIVNSKQNQENTTIANNAVQTGTQEAQGNYAASLAGNQQDYSHALQSYGTGQTATAAQQALESQQFGQAESGYGTAYQSALENYMEPLNATQAVLGGEQVNTPTFPNFATQAQTSGPNMSGAAQDTAAYNQGIYNVNAQTSSNNTNAALGAIGTAAMIAFM